MLGPLDVFRDVVGRLEKSGIDYYLVGSLAATYYGRPRFTNDVDLVLHLKAAQVSAFESLFEIQDYYCPPKEIISDEVIRRGSFNLIHQTSGVKVDIVILKATPFSESEFSRRRKIELIPGFEAYVASAEDVILKKLDYYREGGSEKHLTDIKGILFETVVDDAYIAGWVAKLGLSAEWQKAQ